MLCLAAAGADSIASGKWLNVRSFPPEKFYKTLEDDISRRAVWYYCLKALSEYKIPFLDIAQRVGILDEMYPESNLDDYFAHSLFSGVMPSSVLWGETDAFRHYLTTLQGQVKNSQHSTFEQTRDYHLSLLDEAEKTLRKIRAKGVFGQARDFFERIDVNRSALFLLESARGPLLSRNWNKIFNI